MKINKAIITLILTVILIISIMGNYRSQAASSFTANVGEELSLEISNIRNKNAEWKIQDPRIARLTSVGKAGISIGSYSNYSYSVDLIGESKGTTILKLVDGETVFAIAVIVITNDIRDIFFTTNTIKLEPGEEYQAVPKFEPETPDDVDQIIWTSSDETVATVDNNGNIKALEEGQAVIKAERGEYSANVYVTVKEIPEYTLGDVNSDGKINTMDAILILQSISKKIELNEAQFLAADVNVDESVNTMDAIKVLQYISKKISNF